MKLIIIDVLPLSFINFRGKLIEKLIIKHEAVALASCASDKELQKIDSLGIHYLDYSVQRNSLYSLKNFNSYQFSKMIFKREKSDLELAYTIKPVILGGFAARSTDVHFLC